MSHILFKALQREFDYLKPDLDNKIKEVLKSEELINENIYGIYPLHMGSFEKKFAEYCNTKYALGTNSCTSALYLSLLAIDVGKGDEVIVPVNTYIATALSVKYTEAKPVFVDAKEDTFNIDPEKIEEKITPKTKAIIVVHLYGLPAEMEAIENIAKKHNLKIIEDCAQAHGAEYEGKKVGSFGELGCFSFYTNKNLGVPGDAGIIVTNNEEHFNLINSMREYRGINSGEELLRNCRFPTRISLILSAILEVKLKHLDVLNKKRKAIAHSYNNFLSNIELILPKEQKNSSHVYFAYVIRAKERDKLKEFLLQNKIPCIIEYEVPLHLQKTFSYLGYKEGDFPVGEKLSKEILSLPMNPFLNEEEIEYISKEILQFLNKN